LCIQSASCSEAVVKVLIAEDSATVRRLVAARLIADGYEVLEASDGEEALKLAREEAPDLLVLDKVMPKLDGFEVIRALREDPRTSKLPIVMLTERTNEEDVLGGLDLPLISEMLALHRRIALACQQPADVSGTMPPLLRAHLAHSSGIEPAMGHGSNRGLEHLF
jgi:CheY-like chemotaxis protein